jgi:hypothetical protein
VYGRRNGKTPRRNRVLLRETTVYVDGLRSQSYDIGRAGTLKGLGGERPIGFVELPKALGDLLDVVPFLLDWKRRERLADPVRWPAELRGPLNENDSLPRVHDVLCVQALAGKDVHGWLRRYTSKDKIWRARRKFEDRWLDFVQEHGPLGTETDPNDFGSLATYLAEWAAHVEQQPVAVDLPDVVAMRTCKTERVRGYLRQIVRVDGQWRSPSLFGALAFAICERKQLGFSYGVCENPLCERTFVKTRADSNDPGKRHRHCSTPCRVAANRAKRA